MIKSIDIIFGQSIGNDSKYIYLEVLDVTKSKQKFDEKPIFILKTAIIINSKEEYKNIYYNNENTNTITILLIGGGDNENNEDYLFTILTSGKMSLLDIEKKLKYYVLSQVDDEGTYRYINKHLSYSNAIKFLSLIKDMGTGFHIKRTRKFVKNNSHKIFSDILFKNTSSYYAFTHGHKILSGTHREIYNMQSPPYLTIEDFENKKYKLHFSKYNDINIPLHVLIGENGSGKTFLLNGIAKNYLSLKYDSHDKNELFSRVIALSNTINDHCYRPANITKDRTKTDNYNFISLTAKKHYDNLFIRGRKLTLLSLIEMVKKRDTTKEGFFRQSQLLDKVTETVIPNFSIGIKTNNKEIKQENFSRLIDHYMPVSFNGDAELSDGTKIEYTLPDEEIIFYKEDQPFELSSGQLAFLTSMFALISMIETNSLILIEEPENYLHPSLLTNFINSLTKILRDTNSVAIATTHSALVLREVPSQQVTILHRNNGVTRFKKTKIETFGADTHQIMIDVFGDLYSNAIFRTEISNLAKNKTISEILMSYADLPSDLLNKIIMEARFK
ncbi:AAA family ATPase [Aeromonas salmonicida]|uniref:AAA family ATPase n=1 Tax=Aeromonas salmonicida TaxID=645 RepID=UPI003F7C4EE9